MALAVARFSDGLQDAGDEKPRKLNVRCLAATLTVSLLCEAREL
jgi:hypothetical protein